MIFKHRISAINILVLSFEDKRHDVPLFRVRTLWLLYPLDSSYKILPTSRQPLAKRLRRIDKTEKTLDNLNQIFFNRFPSDEFCTRRTERERLEIPIFKIPKYVLHKVNGMFNVWYYFSSDNEVINEMQNDIQNITLKCKFI